ncbi:MAG: penicillin acylase family protein, partial [Bacteroidota bacterium]
GQELQIGRAVAKLGEEKVKDLYWFHPKEPNLKIDSSINTDLLSDDILALYNAYRKPVEFRKEHIAPAYQSMTTEETAISSYEPEYDSYSIGSNNWVISGSKMEDGNSYMANDPHRTIAVPSLRYMNHLVAPGWNVIGGGEPEIPGISIGHNEYGSWGLTVFRTDGEDLYVYELNPENPLQYKYMGEWVDMTQITETIKIKGQENHIAKLYYTQHGPVTHIDAKNNVAYAVRCAWLEPGGSPYLASLRMDQAKTWEEFREACNYSHIPGENMIWADKEGNIGWQAVGIAPVRRNFSGLVPVPGDGRYEWDGYLPIVEKPNAYNPSEGFLATANQNVTPEDYGHWDAIGFSWSDPYRGDRVNEVLGGDKKLTMENMKALQTDYLSIPARILVPMLNNLVFTGKTDIAQKRLTEWNYKLEASSIPAAIYAAWEDQIKAMANEKFIPEEGRGIVASIQLARIIEWLESPDEKFGVNPVLGRNEFLSNAFNQAVDGLEKNLGPDMNSWQYGQEKNKHTYMQHALSTVVQDSIKAKLDLGPLPRGGNAYTPGSTGSNLRQSSGASFRMIVNTGNWDAALGSNGPGQSGNPDSPFYNNLFEPWANDEYFPVYYSREKIDSVAVSTTKLVPLGK